MAIVILDDRPVDADHDLLWTSLPIRGELERIAETIVRSKDEPTSPSMTFAVHGKWGTGKSSALRMLRSFVRRMSVDASKKPIFCEYQAPALQAARRDARTTLAMRILQSIAMAGDVQKVSQRLDDYARIIDRDLMDGAGSATGETAEKVWDAALFDRISAVLTSIPDLCGIIIRRELESAPEKERKLLVVLLDDLDRCGSDFVLSLLQEIQYLSDIDNLFFVMAVDEEILRAAVRSQARGSSSSVMETDRELEKYLQHAVWVPSLGAARAKEYVKSLAASSPRVKALLDPLLSHGDEPELFDLLLEGLHEMTPRSVKRYLNLLAPKVDGALAARKVRENDILGRRAIIKEKMIETTWPDFHRNVLAQAVEGSGRGHAKGDPKAIRLVAELEGIGRDALLKQAPDTKVQHDLKYVCEEYPHMALGELPVKLVRYLAIGPSLPFPWVAVDEIGSPSLVEQPGLEAFEAEDGTADPETPADLNDRDLEGLGMPRRMMMMMSPLAADTATRGRGVNDTPAGSSQPNPLRQFHGIYMSMVKGVTSDPQRALHNAQRAYDLVQANRTRFNHEHAFRVLEIAVHVSGLHNVELTRKLGDLAVELAPVVAREYVAIIIQNKLAELYPRAAELIRIMQTSGVDDVPECTFFRELQLAELENRPVDIPPARLHKLVDDFVTDPRGEVRYSWLMRSLRHLAQASLARRAAKARYSIVDGWGAVTTLQQAAEVLAVTSDTSNEREALELYRYVLDQPGTRPRSRTQFDTLCQYASLLFKHGYEHAAGEMWFRAYRIMSHNEDLRREYSAYLMRANAPDLARKVEAGEEIDRMVTLPKQKELPASFVGPDVERWWEKKKVDEEPETAADDYE